MNNFADLIPLIVSGCASLIPAIFNLILCLIRTTKKRISSISTTSSLDGYYYQDANGVERPLSELKIYKKK